MARLGSKTLLKYYLLERIGTKLTSAELLAASGNAVEWARRIRELRDEEGWPILTHHDTTKLKPGEYLLDSLPPAQEKINFARGISAKLRAEVLDRNGFTCQMCGLTPGEIDPATQRKVRLHIGHIKDKSLGGADELSNLRSLCSSCNQGAKNITTEKPSTIWLLTQIRRAGLEEQKSVYQWLHKKFNS